MFRFKIGRFWSVGRSFWKVLSLFSEQTLTQYFYRHYKNQNVFQIQAVSVLVHTSVASTTGGEEFKFRKKLMKGCVFEVIVWKRFIFLEQESSQVSKIYENIFPFGSLRGNAL
jgi:hypothetical protein